MRMMAVWAQHLTDDPHDEQMFERVMQALETYVAQPLVLRPGVAIIHATRLASWIDGSEHDAAAFIVEALTHDTGLTFHAGVGSTLATSVLAARRGLIIPDEQTADFLAPYGLAQLRDAMSSPTQWAHYEPILDVLATVGVHTCGQCVELGRTHMSARFGMRGAQLWDEAAGMDHRHPWPRPQEQALHLRRDLDQPVNDDESVVFLTSSLAGQMHDELSQRGCSITRFTLGIGTSSGRTYERSWAWNGYGPPDAHTIATRMRWLCHSMHTRHATTITAITLSAWGLNAPHHRRPQLWGGQALDSDQRLQRALGRLIDNSAHTTLLRPRLHPGRRYCDQLTFTPWGEEEAPSPLSVKHTHQRGWWGQLPSPAPSVICRPTQPIQLLDQCGHDVTVSERGILSAQPHSVRISPHSVNTYKDYGLRAGQFTVTHWAGPWLYDEHWWEERATTATCGGLEAYGQLICEHIPALLCAYRSPGQWAIDGLYA